MEITRMAKEKISAFQAVICRIARIRQIGARIVSESTFPYFKKKIRAQFKNIKNKIKISPKKELSISEQVYSKFYISVNFFGSPVKRMRRFNFT